MRVATGLESTVYACACLSFTTQVLYSFCQTELSERGATPPWQLGEAQEPGPVYLGGSAASPVSRETPISATSRRVFKNSIL